MFVCSFNYLVPEVILNSINKSNCHPFEVETTDGIVTKCVIRCEYDESRDISIVVRDGFVLTSWLNQKNDFHATLDRSKYEGGRQNDWNKRYGYA